MQADTQSVGLVAYPVKQYSKTAVVFSTIVTSSSVEAVHVSHKRFGQNVRRCENNHNKGNKYVLVIGAGSNARTVRSLSTLLMARTHGWRCVYVSTSPRGLVSD